MKFSLPALLLSGAGVWAKGFLDDCEDIAFWDLGEGGDRDYILEASCGEDKKRVIIPLDMCVANQGGKLVFRNQLVTLPLPAPFTILHLGHSLNFRLMWLSSFSSHLRSGWMSSSCKECRAKHNATGYHVGCKCKGFNGKWSQINENNISVEGGWLNLSMFQYLLPMSYFVSFSRDKLLRKLSIDEVFVYENGAFNCHFEWN